MCKRRDLYFTLKNLEKDVFDAQTEERRHIQAMYAVLFISNVYRKHWDLFK